MPNIEFVPFVKAHYDEIVKVGPPVGSDGPDVDEAVLKYMEKGISFTLLVDEVPVAIGGIIETIDGKLAYGYLTRKAGPHMLRIARFSRKILGIAGAGKILGGIQVGFNAGERFARMMGMQPTDIPPTEIKGAAYKIFALTQE
jgi:hypothetical protein